MNKITVYKDDCTRAQLEKQLKSDFERFIDGFNKPGAPSAPIHQSIINASRQIDLTAIKNADIYKTLTDGGFIEYINKTREQHDKEQADKEQKAADKNAKADKIKLLKEIKKDPVLKDQYIDQQLSASKYPLGSSDVTFSRVDIGFMKAYYEDMGEIDKSTYDAYIAARNKRLKEIRDEIKNA